LVLAGCALQNLMSQSTTGNLEGWIVDTHNQPVVSANIQVTSPDLQGIRGTVSDENGYFRIAALPVGTYSTKISHISFKEQLVNDINLILGQTTTLGEILMTERAIEEKEVVVSGSRPVVDTRSAANTASLRSTQFSPLPLERNYFHIAELLPSANVSYKSDGGTNFSGSTGVENRYFIDGAEVTGTENGILRFNLPYNFIRQVEVRTGGYQAEYQSALGGIINTVTYSGGNEFHGTVFGFLTNNNFSRAPRLSAGAPPQGSYGNYDAGFGLGGPILADQLWFYAAYDPEVVSEDVYVNGLGNRQSWTTTHKFAGKLTWSVDQSNVLTLSLCGNPFTGRRVYESPELVVTNPEVSELNITEYIYNAAVKGIHNVSDNFMLESSVSIAVLDGNLSPISQAGSAPTFNDYVNGTASGGQGTGMWKPGQQRVAGSLKGVLDVPDHIVKAGVELAQRSTKNDFRWQLIERYPTYYDVVDQSTSGAVKSNDFSVYVQDSWQISQRLCLNAGLRWDPQWLIASDGSAAQSITDQWQPRVGLVYLPSTLGTQKITASYGRFYEPLLLSLSTLYHVKGSYWGATFYPNDPRVDTSGASSTGNLAGFVTNVPDLKGQYYDEFSVGYERQLSSEFKVGARGVYRSLGQGIEDGVVSDADQIKYNSVQVYGNPGSGVLSALPTMKREYTALELTLQRFAPSGINFLVSYVLSRNWGNYDGFAETYDVSGGSDVFPNNTNQFGLADRMVNADGLLPNDRTHVFKFFGSYVFDFGLTTGMILQWMSGTPLNEFGRDAMFGASTFLQPRGTVGRTPSIWDLSFRFKYDLASAIPIGMSTRLILDVLHVASQRKAIDYQQYRYYDYEQLFPNPNYMVPVQFQPPMSVRVGMEIDF
jgi:hypothetical protein